MDKFVQNQIKEWSKTLEKSAYLEANRLLSSGAIDLSDKIPLGAIYKVVLENISNNYIASKDHYNNLKKI